MRDALLLGFGRHIVPIPSFLWRRQVARTACQAAASLAFMSDDHRRVRDFVVREIPRRGALPPAVIAAAVDLPAKRVTALLGDLERRLTFLFRNAAGAVEWAYPHSAANTPHELRFSTGERLHAAWSVDAIASPFVQGQLTGTPITVEIDSACAHCGEPLHLATDGERMLSVPAGAAPLVFAPLVDFRRLRAPSIIDDFWRHAVFFWSEEHARAHRQKPAGRRRGSYFTLTQAIELAHVMQSALFAFPRLSH